MIFFFIFEKTQVEEMCFGEDVKMGLPRVQDADKWKEMVVEG